jgi:hypothetical protein
MPKPTEQTIACASDLPPDLEQVQRLSRDELVRAMSGSAHSKTRRKPTSPHVDLVAELRLLLNVLVVP